MKCDIAVIGGGPAGMIAAGRAGEIGSCVVLIEKNERLGTKLLITGKGRCNITNKKDEPKEIIEKFGKNGKFLFSSFSKFGVKETIDIFENHGVSIKVERGDRVFPVSDKSQDVLGSLIRYLRKSKVRIRTNSKVRKIIKKGNKIEKVILVSNEEIIADNFIFCTGGKSYPTTGSTGDGYKWAEKVGHTITNLSPSLVPVAIKEKYMKELEGLSLKNVEISLYKGNKKIDSRFGEAIFTSDGMSGPIILDMSKEIGKESPNKTRMQIDFKPALDFVKLDKRIQRDFQKSTNKLFKNSFSELLPKRLIPVIVRLSRINPNKKADSITREERKRLLHLLKEFSLEIKGLEGFKKAVITSGGVELSEVDQRTMRSKLIDNLYFAGEILDLDGPTGGYNLQVCWTTGYIAGENAAQNLEQISLS